MSTTEDADFAAHDVKALRQRAARLGCRLLKRRGWHWLLDKDDDTGSGFESLEGAADQIGRRERGDPLTICTPCGTPLYTTDPKTGKTIDHQTERALADLPTAIKTAHEQAERALRDGLQHAIRAGELLLLAKRQVEHGEWENWLQASVPFQPRTARAYMQLARLNPEKRQRVADLPLREALSAIRSREQKIADAEERENRSLPLCNESPPPRPPIPPAPPISPEEIANDLVHQLRECAQQGNVSDAAIVAEFKQQYEGQDDPQMEDDPNVADAATVEDNALHTLSRMNEHARVFKKIFKLSSFDREARDRIGTAIDRMILKWRSTQATLNAAD